MFTRQRRSRIRFRALALFLSIVAGLVVSPRAEDEPAEATRTPEPPQPTLDATVGDMHWSWTPEAGMTLKLRGVQIAGGSSIYVMEPAWTGRFYGMGETPRQVQEAQREELPGGGQRITIRHQRPEDNPGPFAGREIHTLTPDHRLEVRLEFEMSEDVPAIIEWNIGGVNPDLLMGAAASAEPAEALKATGGRVPVESPGAAVDESTVARDFTRLQLGTRLGPVIFEASSEAGVVLFDYRRNRWARLDHPIFWLGVLSRPIEPRQQHSWRFVFDLSGCEPAPASILPVPDAAITAAPVPDARRPVERPEVIVPSPKEWERGTGRFALSGELIPTVAFPASIELTDQLLGEFQAVADLVREGPAAERFAPLSMFVAPPYSPDLLLYILQRDGEPAADLDTPQLEAIKAFLDATPHPEEAYHLEVTPDHVVMAALTTRGLYYGAATLSQLLNVEPATGALHYRTALIRDWPSLPWRGVHALTGRGQGQNIAHAVRRLMARHKVNTFVWECQYIVWEAAPELEHPEFGMAKDDARRVIDAARENCVEIIPLVQALGHAEWMFTGGRNLDYAEDPEKPYAIMPTNPEAVEFLKRVLAEAVELFQPRVFHIGHDEVTMFGRFPYRSLESGKSVTELVSAHIIDLHGWFAGQGIAVMLWGDMFLGPQEGPDATHAPSREEARRRRDLLPRDVQVADWHYAATEPENYVSLPMWRQEGFEVVAASWYNPENIRQHVRAALDTGAMGHLQTTWAGFNFQIEGNEKHWFQYWSWILAAHYAWSGDTTPAEDLPWNPRDLFLELWAGESFLTQPHAGVTLDLGPVVNRPLADADATGFLGFGSIIDLSALPSELRTPQGTLFRISNDADGRPAALVLAGLLNPRDAWFPQAARLDLEAQPVAAREWRLLMAAPFRTREGAKAGSIVFETAAGEPTEVELVHGRNLFAFTDNRVGLEARLAWEGASQGGKTLRLWELRLDGPGAGSPVKAITITSTSTEAAPMLLAVTAVTE